MTIAAPKPIQSLPDNEPGYGQLLAVLLRRWPWLVGGVVSAMTIGLILGLRQPPVYESSMQLLVEPNYQTKQGTQGPENQFTDNNVQVDYATQINLMRSSDLVRQAMEILQKSYPAIDPQDQNRIEKLRQSINITQLTEGSGNQRVNTKIFRISYAGTDASKTRDILEALQKVYQDYNLEQQRQRLAKGLNFITRQLPEVEAKVKQSETELERFRNSQGIVNPEEQARAQEAKLNQLRQEQQVSLAEIRSLQSRYNALQSQVSMSPEQALVASRLSQSTRYQTILSEIQKTELALVQQRLRFKNNTPYVQQLVDQRQRLLNQLQAEGQRAVGDRTSSGMGGDSQLRNGQLGGVDLSLVGEYLTTYNNLQSVTARYNSQLVAEQQVRAELKRFPRLLAEYGRLQPEVDLNRDTLKQLLKAQQDLGLEIARGGFDWQVVEAPQLGGRVSPGLSRNLLLGAVVGLFLGGILAFLREAMDESVHSADDLRKQSTAPLLGQIPQLKLEEESDLPFRLPFLHSQQSAPSVSQIIRWKPFRESLDLLYQNLQLTGEGANLRSLVVTSAQAGEGKSTLVLGLAISAARLHQRVLVVDADLRRPSLHSLLNLPNEQGLSTLLSTDSPLPTRLNAQASNIRTNISVLTAGPLPPDPAKLLSSQRMQEVIATFEQNYDLVLIDVPPVLGMVDAILAASRTSGVIMVGRMDQVKRSEFNQAIASLDRLNLIGVVANGVAHSSHKAIVYQPQTA